MWTPFFYGHRILLCEKSVDFFLILADPFPFPGLQLLDTVSGGEVLRHGPTKVFYSLPPLPPHFKVGRIGLFLSMAPIPPQLLLGLCSAEQIRRKFRAPHMIEYLLGPP